MEPLLPTGSFTFGTDESTARGRVDVAWIGIPLVAAAFAAPLWGPLLAIRSADPRGRALKDLPNLTLVEKPKDRRLR
jgi:hypothetical protein